MSNAPEAALMQTAHFFHAFKISDEAKDSIEQIRIWNKIYEVPVEIILEVEVERIVRQIV